jgi:hypothetical protein
MTISITEIVNRTIGHAQRLADEGVHDWPTARFALTRILADLEARSPGEPSLERLCEFIAVGDRAWNAREGQTK